MAKIMDQGDIDRMFAVQSETSSSAPSGALQPYNFGQAGQISNDQMRAIGLVNEQFARSLTNTLGAWLRSEMTVAIAANEQLPFSDVVATLPEPHFICPLRLEPLGGVGLMEINIGLALMMVDMLLGGRGQHEKAREMTEIEDTILLSVLEIVVRELNAAWSGAGLIFAMERRETHSQVSRMMPADERTLCISLDIEMEGVHGMLNLCLPAVILNTMHRRLLSMRDKPRQRMEASSARVAELMCEAKLPVTLRLPRIPMRTAVLHAMQPGTLLELPLPRHSTAELRIGDKTFAAASPIRRGDHRAAQLLPLTAMMPQPRALNPVAELTHVN